MKTVSITRKFFGLGRYAVTVQQGDTSREVWTGKSKRMAFYEARRVAIISGAAFIQSAGQLEIMEGRA